MPNHRDSSKLALARRDSASTLYRVENGFVNLVAVVGFLIVAIGLIPMVLFLGSHSSSRNEQTEGTEPNLAGTPRTPKHD
jgi:hypothetical protein